MAVFAGVFAIPLETRRFEKRPGSNPSLSAINNLARFTGFVLLAIVAFLWLPNLGHDVLLKYLAQFY